MLYTIVAVKLEAIRKNVLVRAEISATCIACDGWLAFTFDYFSLYIPT